MVSYRTVKRLLGETSLERKCRFLLGGSLLVLIMGSFYVYARLNLDVIRNQYRQRAQLLIAYNQLAVHAGLLQGDDSTSETETNPKVDPAVTSSQPEPAQPERSLEPSADTVAGRRQQIELLAEQFKPSGLREKNWRYISPDPAASTEKRPTNLTDGEAIKYLTRKLNEIGERVSDPATPLPFFIHEDSESAQYQHFEPIIAGPACVKCHQFIDPGIKENALLRVCCLNFPLTERKQDIARNNAILITLAVVTSFLAMLAAYAIVRYVIVKPVLHLKDVSDAIAHGELDQRADIHTGDEFEELSHAFNRMLRQLLTTQEELRHANGSLDVKVDELAQANLSLHEMAKLKNEFLTTMSHELRTPLNSILGFSDVLFGADNLNERQRKYVGNIQTSGRSLLTLINEILDLAKMEAGKMEVHPTEFTLDDLVERLVALMGPLAEKKNISLDSVIASGLPVLLQDNGKMQQILYNLLSNAVKFTPEGGRIKVTAQRFGSDEFDLIVTDTGIGIPLEDQALIFEKFRQGRNMPGQEDALTREFEGTGLGLSIVKELCKLLGGEIFLHSEFGKGSTFTIRLPLVVPPRVAEESPSDFSKLKI